MSEARSFDLASVRSTGPIRYQVDAKLTLHYTNSRFTANSSHSMHTSVLQCLRRTIKRNHKTEKVIDNRKVIQLSESQIFLCGKLARLKNNLCHLSSTTNTISWRANCKRMKQKIAITATWLLG